MPSISSTIFAAPIFNECSVPNIPISHCAYSSVKSPQGQSWVKVRDCQQQSCTTSKSTKPNLAESSPQDKLAVVQVRNGRFPSIQPQWCIRFSSSAESTAQDGVSHVVDIARRAVARAARLATAERKINIIPTELLASFFIHLPIMSRFTVSQCVH
ncbi:hypothetical protein EXIGLDRAFT_692181 [Exidia glandulosa HHB12029]|uniref:Uncharacterized protein n=1 Tax=Exidia glandulosa HHB12029 TaxID=1314781 RepID=A0A165I5U5_EXIGL|nr:hypothetical protein EXIGLDRAFT_692181 [Exidia glandulosa HHB12029]